MAAPSHAQAASSAADEPIDEVKQAKARLPWVDQLPRLRWPPDVHPSVVAATKCGLLPPELESGLRVERLELAALNVELILVGTNHAQPSVAAAAERLIHDVQPHAVMVEMSANSFPRLQEAVDEVTSAALDHRGIAGSSGAPATAAASAIVHPWLARALGHDPSTLFRTLMDCGISGASKDAAGLLAAVLAVIVLQADISGYGGDMIRSATAALQSGAMLFLGDRDYPVTSARQAQEALLAQQHRDMARQSSGSFFADLADTAAATAWILTDNWERVATAILEYAARDRADDFAKGSPHARSAAVNPQLDVMTQVLAAAIAETLKGGAAAADAHAAAAAAAVADPIGNAAMQLAAGGRRAWKDFLWLLVAAATVPDEDQVQSYFLAQEGAAQRKLAATLLLPNGELQHNKQSADGTAALVRARRAAAGTMPGGGYGPDDHEAAVVSERDAILASSILHMRDAIERSAECAAVPAEGPGARHTAGRGVAVVPRHVGSSSDRLALVSAASDSVVPLGRRAAELVDDWSSPSPLADKQLRLVAVVGAAHVPGILRYLRAADTLASQAAAHIIDNWRCFSTTVEEEDDSSNTEAFGFNTAAAHAELVRQGFLPSQPFIPLQKMFPRQLDALHCAAAKAPTPAAAAAAAANAERESTQRALLRAVAACSVDEQIAPTLSADPGFAFKLKCAVAPVVATTACAVLPFMRKAPRPLRRAAGAVTLTAVAAAGAMLAAAVKVVIRLDTALDAADRRCGGEN